MQLSKLLSSSQLAYWRFVFSSSLALLVLSAYLLSLLIISLFSPGGY